MTRSPDVIPVVSLGAAVAAACFAPATLPYVFAVVGNSLGKRPLEVNLPTVLSYYK